MFVSIILCFTRPSERLVFTEGHPDLGPDFRVALLVETSSTLLCEVSYLPHPSYVGVSFHSM